MKTKFSLLFVMLLSSLCITFTSCSDDDNDDYAKEIAGIYKGNVYPKDNNVAIASDATITITRNSDKNVTLKINETIATLPIDVECNSDVVYTNEKYQVSGATTFKMGGIPLPVTINGEFDKSGNATINIDIPLAEIFVVYKGKKQ